MCKFADKVYNKGPLDLIRELNQYLTLAWGLRLDNEEDEKVCKRVIELGHWVDKAINL